MEALESTIDQVKYPFKIDTITAGTQSTHQCVTRVSGYNTSSQHSTERRPITHRNALRSNILSQGGAANGVIHWCCSTQ